MTRNQLPDGVGKKIVEALKRQQTEGATPEQKGRAVIEENKDNDNIITENDLADFEKTVENVPEVDNFGYSDDLIIEEDDDTVLNEIENVPDITLPDEEQEDDDFAFSSVETKVQEPQQNQILFNNNPVNVNLQPSVETQKAQEQPILKNTFMQNTQNISTVNNIQMPQPTANEQKPASNIKIPYNVAILNNLIATLPAGVNKQVGAQIIRQTLEATGLSMTGVLKEAQELQEQLNDNSRECMIKIQEYKTNIMQLEQKVQEYQKNVAQINDLISLFLLTDRK